MIAVVSAEVEANAAVGAVVIGEATEAVIAVASAGTVEVVGNAAAGVDLQEAGLPVAAGADLPAAVFLVGLQVVVSQVAADLPEVAFPAGAADLIPVR